MKGLSPELFFYILFFVVIMLVQYFVQRARKNTAEEQEPVEERQEEVPDVVWGRQPHAILQEPLEATPAAVMRPATAAVSRQGARRSPRPAKRFSRQSLFGNKQRTQDALVAATILGPCRAFEPYDMGR